jgi:hypothetical protein
MNAPIATVLRGSAAVTELRDLLDQLETVDKLVADKSGNAIEQAARIAITIDEVQEVIAHRRAYITNKLENKNIKIAPEPDLSPVSDEA